MRDALQQTVFDMWRILSQGGWVMGALFCAGQVGWFLVLERWWHFHKMDGKPEAFFRRVVSDNSNKADKSQALDTAALTESLQRPKGLFGAVARSVTAARGGGQEAMVERAREALQKDVPDLGRHLNTIAVLATAAPLFGLAGTVAGIMQTFHVITLYGAGNPSMLAGGIAQALMVTEAGLVVAFPLLICHDLLRKRADKIEDSCVAAVTHLIRLYAGNDRGGGSSAGLAGKGALA